MHDVEYTITVHERPDGSIPFQEALMEFGSHSPALLAAVEAGLIRLERKSNHGGTFTKYLSRDIWYMKVKNARVFFTFQKGARIIMLNGFVKSQKKTPISQIKRANILLREVRI